MKILITGGTGFIGTYLSLHLIRKGHEVNVLAKASEHQKESIHGITYIHGDCTQKGPWQSSVRDHDVIINLAGASIFRRWTEPYKKLLIESRISTTKNLVEGIPYDSKRPITLFSASAVGYYGFHEDEEITEKSAPGDDFLSRLAFDWEAEALKAEERGARVVLTRFGIVLGKNGGALGQMIPLFKMFIGGPIGNGRQWFSWIHIKDLAESIDFLIKHPEISGPVNLCAPNPVSNKDLAKALGKALNRPSFVPAPEFMINLLLGEFGTVILKGQRVIPSRLFESGFKFQYPEIDKALQSIVAH